MEEIIDNNRKCIERTLDRVIIPHIQKVFLLAEPFHLGIQFGPVASISLTINSIVERNQIRVLFGYIIQDPLFLITT